MRKLAQILIVGENGVAIPAKEDSMYHVQQTHQHRQIALAAQCEVFIPFKRTLQKCLKIPCPNSQRNPSQ